MKEPKLLKRAMKAKVLLAAGLLIAVAVGGAALLNLNQTVELSSKAPAINAKKVVKANVSKTHHKDLSSETDQLNVFLGFYELTESAGEGCGEVGSRMKLVYDNQTLRLMGTPFRFSRVGLEEKTQNPYPGDSAEISIISRTYFNGNALVRHESYLTHKIPSHQLENTLTLEQGVLTFYSNQVAEPGSPLASSGSARCTWTHK